VRPWLLHARARGLPAALLGWAALAAVVAITHARQDADAPFLASARAALPVMAGAFAAVLAAGCLAGHDELEDASPRAGRGWRLLHWLALGVLSLALPAVGWLAVADAVQASARLALMTVGLYGLAVAGTVLFGAARAWAVVLGHLLTGLVLAPVDIPTGPGRWLLTSVTWPTLPTGTPAVLAVSATAVVGLLALAARPVRH
jgi:hypothetical protein